LYLGGEKVKKGKEITEEVASLNIGGIGTYYQYQQYFDNVVKQELFDIMRKDSTIYSNLDSRLSTLKRKKIKIVDVDTEKEAIDIQKRLSNDNLNSLISHLFEAVTCGYAIIEIMYNPDYTIKEYKKQPREWFYYDVERQEWYMNRTAGEKLYIETLYPNKFIITTFEADKKNLYGNGILNNLVETYERKAKALGSLNNQLDKWGNVLLIFKNAQIAGETKEQTSSRVKGMIEAVKKSMNNEVLVMPPSNDKINDLIKIVAPTDLKPVSQQLVLRQCLEEEELVILGASFSKFSDTGTYASDKVSADVKEDKVEADMCFVTSQLQKLIEIDADLYGYDANKYRFEMYDEADITELETNRKLIAETTKTELEVVQLAGYTLSKNYIAERLQINESELEEITVTENVQNGIIEKVKSVKNRVVAVMKKWI